MKEKNIHRLKLKSDFNEFITVDAFIQKAADRANDELLSKIQLAVNEAVTNAILHGNKNDTSKTVIITARQNDQAIEITVEDEGEGFDPASLPDPTAKEHLLKQSGRGVYLIRSYADEVSFEQNGTLIRMQFYLR